MNKATISYKSKNILIEKLEKQSNIEVIKEKSFFSKLFSKKEYADIYFHLGTLDDKSLQNIKNSKITIVNSFSIKKDIIDEIENLNEKIEVIYPCINLKNQNMQEIQATLEKTIKNLYSQLILVFQKI